MRNSIYLSFVIFLVLMPVCLNRELVQLLGGAVAGLHAMIDEHFGISVVEYMAAGAVPIGECVDLFTRDIHLAIFMETLNSL